MVIGCKRDVEAGRPQDVKVKETLACTWISSWKTNKSTVDYTVSSFCSGGKTYTVVFYVYPVEVVPFILERDSTTGKVPATLHE